MPEPSSSPVAAAVSEHLLPFSAGDASPSSFRFTWDNILLALATLSTAFALFVSGVVYTNDLRCFIPSAVQQGGQPQTVLLETTGTYINSYCTDAELRVNLLAYFLWLQSLALSLPLTLFYAVFGSQLTKFLSQIAARYRHNLRLFEKDGGELEKKTFVFALYHANWPLPMLASNTEHQEEPWPCCRPMRFRRDTRRGEKKRNSNAPGLYDDDKTPLVQQGSLEDEVQYDENDEGIDPETGPEVDKQHSSWAFTYSLDALLYPASYVLVDKPWRWLTWAVLAYALQWFAVTGFVVIWSLFPPGKLSLDTSHFDCTDVPTLSESGSVISAVSCVYASTQTLYGIWIVNLALLAAYALFLVCKGLLLLWHIRSDRDFIYSAFLAHYPHLCLFSRDQARDHVYSMIAKYAKQPRKYTRARSNLESLEEGIQEAWDGMMLQRAEKLMNSGKEQRGAESTRSLASADISPLSFSTSSAATPPLLSASNE